MPPLRSPMISGRCCIKVCQVKGTFMVIGTKKVFIPAVLGISLMAGCSSEAGVHVEENTVMIDSAGLRLDIPESWSVMTGKSIYEEIYPRYSDAFDSAAELEKALKEAGEEYIVYALPADSSAVLVVTLQDMTPETGERPTLEKLARTLHDGTLFDYQASGYRTGSNSVFEQTEIAGREGVLSFFELYLPQEVAQETSEPRFEMAQELFMFEDGNDVWSIQFICSEKESELRIEEILSKSD